MHLAPVHQTSARGWAETAFVDETKRDGPDLAEIWRSARLPTMLFGTFLRVYRHRIGSTQASSVACVSPVDKWAHDQARQFCKYMHGQRPKAAGPACTPAALVALVDIPPVARSNFSPRPSNQLPGLHPVCPHPRTCATRKLRIITAACLAL